MLRKLLPPQRNKVLVYGIYYIIILFKSFKVGSTKPVNLWQILPVFKLDIDEDTRVYDNLFFTLCPQLFKFLRPTWAESRSVSNTQYQPVVRMTKLFIKLKYVQITSLVGGLPAILVQRRDISFAK